MTELNLLYGGDNLLSDNGVIERKDNTYSSKISSQQLHQMALNNDVGGGSGGSSGGNGDKMMPPPQSQSMNVAQQQMAAQMAAQQSQQAAQQQMAQQMMQPQLTPQQQQQLNYEMAQRKKNEYNFLDRMGTKKTEVVKLALFSLVIVLGISIDRMLTHYLSRYLNDNSLTDFQELLLRLSYPITIFLLLWIFKAI